MSTYINFDVENNDKDSKFKVQDFMLISKQNKYPSMFFVIKKIKNSVPRTYIIEKLNFVEIIRTHHEKKCKIRSSKAHD